MAGVVVLNRLNGWIFCGVFWLAAGFCPALCQGESAPVYPRTGYADILGMDVYAEGSSIHALLVGKPADGGAAGLYYWFSADAGASWRPPLRLGFAADGKIMSRRGDEAQIAAAGRRIAVLWRRGGGLPGAGAFVSAYSADGGAHWRRGQQPALGDATGNQSYADLAADRAGNFHAVWLDDREENGNTQGLRYARSVDGGRRWQGEATLDAAVCTCCWNRVAALPGGRVAVLYRDDDPHDMRLALSADAGRSWRNLAAVGAFDWRFNGCPHCGGGIAAGPGEPWPLHGVVWSGKDGAEGLYYLRSDDRGGHWSPPLRIGDGRSRESDIAALADGRVGVVYAAAGEGAQFTQSADGGKSWSPPLLLGAAADHPRILATPQGFRAFWTEKRAAGGRVWAMRRLTTDKN